MDAKVVSGDDLSPDYDVGSRQMLTMTPDGKLRTNDSAGATAVQGTEDAPAPADPAGTVEVLVAVDSPANRVADGDYVVGIATRKGERRVVAQLVNSSHAILDFVTANATSRILSAAASTNATSAKASAGTLFGIQGVNAAAATRYLKLYNKASAPVVGTDTPVKTIALQASLPFSFSWPSGYEFSVGIAYALTTGSADADMGALTAGDILGLNIDYA